MFKLFEKTINIMNMLTRLFTSVICLSIVTYFIFGDQSGFAYVIFNNVMAIADLFKTQGLVTIFALTILVHLYLTKNDR